MGASRNELKRKIKKLAYEAEISNNKDVAHILDWLHECMNDPNFYAVSVDRPMKSKKESKKAK